MFSGTSYLPRVIIRNVARQAGAHIYTDCDDVYLTASRNWLVLHSLRAAPVTVPVRLRAGRRVIDVLSRRTLTDGSDTFDARLAPYGTRLFYLGQRDVLDTR